MDEFQKLKDLAKKEGDFSDEELALIPKYFTVKKIEKNEILVYVGEICKHLYFINKGILRTFHINANGAEFTRLIITENQFCTNLLSFTGHSPCVANIQALEKGEVLCITHDNFQEFVKTSQNAFQIYTKILEKFQNFQLNRIEFLTSYSPKEKVKIYFKENAEISDRISDKIAATYLQLTSETFCREKKNWTLDLNQFFWKNIYIVLFENKNKIMNIPYLLILFRFLCAPIIIYFAFFVGEKSTILILILMYLGLFSDIFDGIIARKQNISTEKMRRLDSQTDLVFWLSIGISTWYIFPQIIQENIIAIRWILAMEVSCYVISIVKFGKETCTHAYLSKFWGITLLIAFTSLLGFNYAGFPFYLCIVSGLISHIDVILIILLLPKWQHDVPSSYHAYLIKKGRTIKKNIFFNG